MFDYTIFYKNRLDLDPDWGNQESWDLFISAHNLSERVQKVFSCARASRKCWLILPEYCHRDTDLPSGDRFVSTASTESAFIREFLEPLRSSLSSGRLCVDTTGFIPPYLLFLLRFLPTLGLKKIDLIYSEPSHYSSKEETRFTDQAVQRVRQVDGFNGMHVPDVSNDYLIVTSGYEHKLMSYVAEHKASAQKKQIFGLPPLRADMYQENILQAYKARETLKSGIEGNERFFAPAHDPFATAMTISDLVSRIDAKKKITNLYLAPLSTKPHLLGVCIYYLRECVNRPVSVIFPFCAQYTLDSSRGISRIWKYEMNFEAIGKDTNEGVTS